MSGKKIRILVVEDSPTVRNRICEILKSDSDFELVGEALDGQQAIELCRKLRPDVVSMDMMLPVVSGLAATEQIMAFCPTPILVVSSSINRGELFQTYEALAAGAVDVLDKSEADDPQWESRLLSTLKLVSRIRVITHPRARLNPDGVPRPCFASVGRSSASLRVLAVGASTGGPAAIVKLLSDLPVGFVVPILVVIHISQQFAAAFAEWLDGLSSRRVRYAHQGERVEGLSGCVILAPPDRHLVVQDLRLQLSEAPERHSCRPSVDLLFESVAREYGAGSAACLLTGMGRDGASGLLTIRRAGGFTIAQDEASSVIYGMPREAVLLGAAQAVLPLDQIGPTLATL